MMSRNNCRLLLLNLACLTSLQSADAQNAQSLAYLGPNSSLGSTTLDTERSKAQNLYQSGQFAQALLLYHQICSGRSNPPTALDFYWLGESYAHTEQYDHAAKAFSEAMKLETGNEKLQVRYAESLLSSHKLEQAAEACKAALGMVKTEAARQKLLLLLKISSKPEPEAAMQRGKLNGLWQQKSMER